MWEPLQFRGSGGLAGWACSYFTGSCNWPWVERCYCQGHTRCLTLHSPTPPLPPPHHNETLMPFFLRVCPSNSFLVSIM